MPTAGEWTRPRLDESRIGQYAAELRRNGVGQLRAERLAREKAMKKRWYA